MKTFATALVILVLAFAAIAEWSRRSIPPPPGAGAQDSKAARDGPSTLDAMRGALDARGFVRILRHAALALHPSLEGVSAEDFDERVLAALKARIAGETERARLAELAVSDVDALASSHDEDEDSVAVSILAQALTGSEGLDLPRVLTEEEEEGGETGADPPRSRVNALIGALLPKGSSTSEPKFDARLALLEDSIVDALQDPFTQVVRGEELLHSVMVDLLQIPSVLGLLAVPSAGGGFEIGVVLRETDAAAKGIRAGDRLLAVDGESVAGMARHAVQEKIARPCRLRLARGDESEPIELDVRAADPGRAETTALLIDEGVGEAIGYLAFPLFRQGAFAELLAAGRELERRGARAFLLDLRGNPGGLVAEAGTIAGLFLRQGQVVAELRQRTKRRSLPERLVSGRPAFPDEPLVVLIDGSSASAAEVVAAALADHGRALLAGTRTFGKGVGQTMLALPIFDSTSHRVLPRLDGVMLTSLALRSPLGHDWHGVGLEPKLRASPQRETRERLLHRAALLDREGLVVELSSLELAPDEVSALRRPEGAPPATAERTAARLGLPSRTSDDSDALKDVVRLAQRPRHPELSVCPELDPVLKKSLAAAKLALKRRAAEK